MCCGVLHAEGDITDDLMNPAGGLIVTAGDAYDFVTLDVSQRGSCAVEDGSDRRFDRLARFPTEADRFRDLHGFSLGVFAPNLGWSMTGALQTAHGIREDTRDRLYSSSMRYRAREA